MNGFGKRIVLVWGIANGFSSLGCDNQPGAPAVNEVSPGVRGGEIDLYSGDPTQIDARFESRLREIAAEYSSQFSLLVGGVRWAPYSCSVPPPLTPTSTAARGTPHGQKLYWLFVKDADAYEEATERAQPVGQTIVKQSWIPEEVKDPQATAEIERDGKRYTGGRPADLFIMFKEEPDTEGTDDGWVYGTATPDGKRITSAGRVAACMECHQSAKPDRLFGAKSPITAAED